MIIRLLQPQDAPLLRKIRLKALLDAPTSFGSSYEEEVAWDLSVFEGGYPLRTTSITALFIMKIS